MGKERAGAADPGLHFVEDEKKVALIAQVTQCAQERRRNDTYATLTLDRLNQDGSRFGAYHGLNRIDIPEAPDQTR
jgi:hypothetical protein